MASISNTCYVSLTSKLDTVSETIQFIEKSINVRNYGYEIFNWSSRPDLQKEFKSLHMLDAVTLDSFCRPLYVTSHAFFENYLRELIASYVDYMNSETSKITELTIKQHMFQSSKALLSLQKPLDHLDINEKRIVDNLYHCVNGKPSLSGEAMIFGFNSSTPESIENVLAKLGVSFCWDALGRVPEVQQVIRTTGTRKTADAIKETLKEMVRNRNRIAHTGDAADVTMAILKDHMCFIRTFSKAIFEFLSSP